MDIHEIHAHVSRETSDCDGAISNEYIMSPNEAEVEASEKANGINDFSEIDFRERVLCAIISVYSCESGRLTVDASGFEWVEQTEEGYRAARVLWCDDDCQRDERTYRDHRAEAAGY